ncbi:MAG: 50S ribosomal protein L6 [Candidatus Doudnabacteria bacterium]|nr:50S ribosomal protein L6 [Candidatus Doudnabacteria bacterium]
MSKIGKKPIVIPDGVQVNIAGSAVKVKGPGGELDLRLHPKVHVEVSGSSAKVSVKNPDDRRQKALWGTFRAILQNMVAGAGRAFERRLEIVGVGYKAAVSGNKLVLNIGYSHPVEIEIPAELEVKVEKNTVSVAGADKQAVGQFAASLRSRRPPEPYKGKGLRYHDEVVRRKAGKVTKAVGG